MIKTQLEFITVCNTCCVNVVACSDGFYGDKCERVCGNCICDTVCNKINGFCETGCAAGYKRQLCTEGKCSNAMKGALYHHCTACMIYPV